MHFEILVEEYSAEKALDNLLPKIITGEHTYRIITFQGKMDMLRRLPVELKGYSKWIGNEYKIVVLIDRDNDDCMELKQQLERFASEAGFLTKTAVDTEAHFSILNRIAIEELEAWFFGDPDALRQAYPKVSRSFDRKAAFRIPDEIKGGTWEALERLLQAAGYYKTGLRKSEVAAEISMHINPLINRSRSFQVFWEGITACISNYEKHNR